ncbi:MAG: adenosylcobinamide-GDP ribazoletransferase, partial [Sphingobacteriales bacterium]
LVFPTHVSLWLAIGCSLLLTGAFHEDGLADTADGLGGGLTRDKKLLIMKDSRIGTYGATALIIALTGKYLLLVENEQLILSLIIAYALSRTVAASLLFDMQYVTDADTSKSKPLANNQSITDLLILIVTATPIFILLPLTQAVMICGALIVYRQLVKCYFNQQIGGYTGDCLGAAQQIGELLIYLLLLIQL